MKHNWPFEAQRKSASEAPSLTQNTFNALLATVEGIAATDKMRALLIIFVDCLPQHRLCLVVVTIFC